MEGASSNPGRGLPRASDTSRDRHILTRFLQRALKSLPGKAKPSQRRQAQAGPPLMLQPRCPAVSSLGAASPSHPIPQPQSSSIKSSLNLCLGSHNRPPFIYSFFNKYFLRASSVIVSILNWECHRHGLTAQSWKPSDRLKEWKSMSANRW